MRPDDKITEEEWIKHFESLLSKKEKRGGEGMNCDTNEQSYEVSERVDEEGSDVDCPTLDSSFSEEEVTDGLKSLANGKAPGEDGIAGEFVKTTGLERVKEFTKVFNKIWKGGSIPEGWESAIIVPIHKNGSNKDARNYRGISLLDMGYKVLTAMMARRLGKWAEENDILKESQAGFRVGRGTREHIFTLNALASNVLARRKGRMYVAFVDFKAAFDTVDRERMIEKLRNAGVMGRMLRMIARIYQKTMAKVRVGNGFTREFETDIGVRQGCALSAIIFCIFIDDIDKEWEERKIGGVCIGGRRICALKYADDITVVSDDAGELRRMLRGLEKYVMVNKLEVNTDKMKIMVFRKGGKLRESEKWKFRDKDIEVVNKFKYLGYWFSPKVSEKTQCEETVGKARMATNAVWGLMKRAGRDRWSERRKLFDTIVKAGVMYGVEV